jgi:hypothetical protein
MCLRKYVFFPDFEFKLLSLLSHCNFKFMKRTDNCNNRAGWTIVIFRLNFAIYSGIRAVKFNTTLNVDKGYEKYNRSVHFVRL